MMSNGRGDVTMARRLLILLAALLMCFPALAEESEDLADTEWSIIDHVLLDDDNNVIPLDEEILLDGEIGVINPAREDFIDRIVALGEELYMKANGKLQRAHYSGDIYVCKNFTTYLFRENRDDFCMAEYPDVELRIPDNLPKEACKPYSYGLLWKDVSAAEGNPFYAAATFRYDSNLSFDENLKLACEFMRQAQRGDFFQMSADYEYGVGAHSAIMLGYDAENDEIHWMDSNMRGGKRDGIRYGMVQFDEVKSVEWWAKTFCHKTRGATLYRLRDDIMYRGDVQ